MTILTKRLIALEAKEPAYIGKVHRITRETSVTESEAIDAYGRSRVADGDHIIMRHIVGPPTLSIVA